MDIIPPNDPSNPASRASASRIRARIKAGTAEPEEIAWLKEYEDSKSKRSRGASAHRRVTFTEEESAAVGEGAPTVAETAAAAAMVREEGRREDSLADRGIKAMERAFERQERLVEFMMSRMQMLEESHLAMWSAHRDSRLREVDAEIELTKALAESEGKGDQISQAVQELLPLVMQQLGASKKR